MIQKVNAAATPQAKGPAPKAAGHEVSAAQAGAPKPAAGPQMAHDGRQAINGLKVVKLEPGKDTITAKLDAYMNTDQLLKHYMLDNMDGTKPASPQVLAGEHAKAVALNGGALRLSAREAAAKVGLGSEIKLPLAENANDYGRNLVLVNKAFGTHYQAGDIAGGSSGWSAGRGDLGQTIELKDAKAPNGKAIYFMVEGKTPGTYEVMTRDAAEKRYPTDKAKMDAFGSWPG